MARNDTPGTAILETSVREYVISDIAGPKVLRVAGNVGSCAGASPPILLDP